MIRKIMAAAVVLMVTGHAVQAQATDTIPQKLSLQQCINIALQNNNDVQRREVTSGIAKENWRYAKGFMLPTLNGDAGVGVQNGRSIDPYSNTYSNQTTRFSNYGLTTSLTLFNAFAVQNSIKQSKLAFRASEFEIQQSKDVVALNVILQYLQILTNQDLLSAAIQQKDVSEKQVERLTILNEEGSISPNLLYDLKGEFANNELTVVNALNDLETARITLAQLLNIPFDRNRQVERLALSELIEENTSTSDSIYRAALQNLALVKAAEARKSSAVYSVKTFRSQRYPALYFSGGLFTNYSSLAATQEFLSSTDVQTNAYVMDNGTKLPVFARQDNYATNKIPYGSQFSNNFNSSVSVGISVPILNNFRNRTQIRTAKLQEKDADIVLNTTKVQLQQNVEQAYVNVNTAKSRFKALNDQVEAYKESFRVAEIKFNAGAINSVDYLVVKNNLDQSNLSLIIAKYDYVLRSMLLDYYSGKLTF